MASDYRFTTYRASSTRSTYEDIMNGESVQQEMLRRANLVAKAVRAQGFDVKTDVRPTPGKKRPGRAHARVSVPYLSAEDITSTRYNKLKAIADDENETEKMREIGRQMTNDAYKYLAYGAWQRNRRIDRVLQAALDAARG